MKPLIVGRKAVIIDGILAGFEGKVVGFDSEADEASVQLDSVTFVETHSENLLQEGKTVQLSLDLGTDKIEDLNEEKQVETDIGAITEDDWDWLK